MSVASWGDLCDQVQAAKKTFHPAEDEELWFRGMSSNKHSLLPSLMRCFKKNPTEGLQGREIDLFFEFLAKARMEQGGNLSAWDVLFLIQHYRGAYALARWTDTLRQP